MPGDVLLSHTFTSAVPSALRGLTSGFGMGPGVSPSPWSPKLFRASTAGYLVIVIIPLNDRVPDRNSGTAQWTRLKVGNVIITKVKIEVSPRAISTSQLHALPHFHLWPINQVIYLGPYPVNPVRVLILKQASRLDAFSGYPFRT